MKIVKNVECCQPRVFGIRELKQGSLYRWIGHDDRTIFVPWSTVGAFAIVNLRNGDNWDGRYNRSTDQWKFVELDAEVCVAGDL